MCESAHAPARRTGEGAELDWFAHDPVAGARAGRQAAEFWRGAVAHLREALALRPAATELSYVLAQAGALGHPNQRAASRRLFPDRAARLPGSMPPALLRECWQSRR